ncbi:MAG: hypothetical protein FWD64_03990 [Acidobacteriaceae bacterium]|nr:hypothetical protein [Acidobacteriaceae bacterium]
MAVIPLYSCLCGTHKKVSNHWVLARITESDIRFFPWDTELAQKDDIIVLCGEACASALLSRVLGEWKQRSVSAGEANDDADDSDTPIDDNHDGHVQEKLFAL